MSKKSNKNNNLNPYSIDKLATVSPKWKVGILKFWVVGAAFFLAIFGLPQRFDYFDRMVAFWLVLVLMYEYIAITIINWMHNGDVNTKKYLPHEIERKSVLSIFATGIYIFIMLVLIHFFFEFWTSLGIPVISNIISETSIDPISYGLVFLLFDYLWIKIRGLIKNIRNKKTESKQ